MDSRLRVPPPMSGFVRCGISGAIGLAAIGSAGLFAAAPALASGTPIITQYAGTGSPGSPTPGPATSSALQGASGVAVDAAGNLFIADTNNSVIEKVTPGGTLSIVAGNGSTGAPTPGPATSSALNQPGALAVDTAGNVYIADSGNNVIEKVTPGGTLSIIAGTGAAGAPTPGPATSSQLDNPTGLALDSAGDVFVADQYNRRIEKVTPGGTLSFVAGNGSYGAPTPGPATSSPLKEPAGIVLDAAGSLYFTDSDNQEVLKVDTSGTLSVFAGNGIDGYPVPGTATSSPFDYPWGLAIDSAGNIYIGEEGVPQVAAVTPSGTLSIVAGNGAYGSPTYGSPATSSPLNGTIGTAVNPDGTLFVADQGNNTIDRVGPATPGPPGQPVLVPGDGSAQLSFTPPTDPGTSAISSYQVSLDAGATWQTITVSPGSGGTLTTTLTGLTDGTTYSALVRAVNGSGAGANSPSRSVTPQHPALHPSVPPGISGPAQVGSVLNCSQGTWSGNPTGFTYQWSLDGIPIPGATGQTYVVLVADQGHMLTCTVTASNAGGNAQATSAGVLIPIVNVSLCPKPSGRLSGTNLGPVWLGMTRGHVRRELPRFNVYSSHTDNFCLARGGGIRVGYATRGLLAKLPGHPHATGIILALTANPYYSFHGINPGMSVRAARTHLALGGVIHLGLNWWYVIRGATANWVLKTRQGVVQEIGIASERLTTTGFERVRLLAHF